MIDQCPYTTRPYLEAFVSEAIAYQLVMLGRYDEANEAIGRAQQRYVDLDLKASHEKLMSVAALDAGVLRRREAFAQAFAIYQEILATETLPPVQARNTRRSYALALLEAGEPQQALEQFSLAGTSTLRDTHPVAQYLAAARAFAHYEADSQAPNPVPLIESALRRFEEQSIEGNFRYPKLRRWRDELTSTDQYTECRRRAG